MNAKYWLKKAIEQDNEGAIEYLMENPELNDTTIGDITYNVDGDIIHNNQGIIAKDDAIVNRASTSSVETNFCPGCGSPVDKDDSFCRKCGRKL